MLNIDINKPKLEDHLKFWNRVDILDKNKLWETIKAFNPSYILHLAAKANLHGKTIEDFPENVQGTKNMITLSEKNKTVKRFVHISFLGTKT